jgi:Domain of unknown function (DUF4190)
MTSNNIGAPAEFSQHGQALPVELPTNSLAIRSLILGCLAFVGLGPIAGIPAVIVGRAAIRQIDQRGERGREIAVAGRVLGTVSVVLFVIALAVFALASLGPSFVNH